MNMYINDYWFLPDKTRTGKKIKEIRLNNELSYYKFAQKIDTNYKTLYSWENGESMPSLKSLKKIREEFNVSLEDLILPDGKMSNVELINEDNVEPSSNNYWFERFFTRFVIPDTNCEISLDEYYKLYFEAKKENPLYEPNVRIYYDTKFDAQNYPIPVHNIDFNLIKEAYVQKKKSLINEDYNLQFKLFSLSYMDEDFSRNNFLKYGELYKTNLSQFTKNYIMYDYFKEKKYDTGLYSVLANILLFNNSEIQILVVDVLPPLFREIVYNSLMILDDKEFDNVVNFLEKNDCKKYKFCKDIQIVDGYNHQDTFFKNSVKRNRQINIYHKALDCIRNKLKELSYDEYLKERI